MPAVMLAAVTGGLFLLVQGQLRWELGPIPYTITSFAFAAVTLIATTALLGSGAGVIGAFVGTGSRRDDRACPRACRVTRFIWTRVRSKVAQEAPGVLGSARPCQCGSADRPLCRSGRYRDDAHARRRSTLLGRPPGRVHRQPGHDRGPAGANTAHLCELPPRRSAGRDRRDVPVHRRLGAWALGRHLPRGSGGGFLGRTGDVRPAATVVPVLAPAIILSGLAVFAPGLAIARRTTPIALISIFGAILNVALCILLVATLGIIGAALATLTSGATAFALTVWYGQRYYPIPYDLGRIGVGLSAVVIVIVLSGVPFGAPIGTAWRIALAAATAALLVSVDSSVCHRESLRAPPHERDHRGLRRGQPRLDSQHAGPDRGRCGHLSRARGDRGVRSSILPGRRGFRCRHRQTSIATGFGESSASAWSMPVCRHLGCASVCICCSTKVTRDRCPVLDGSQGVWSGSRPRG